MDFQTRAKGKLLLSGEYAVLDGATALALPVRFGQSLEIQAFKTPASLFWTSKNEQDETWFSAEFDLPGLKIIAATNEKTAETLASFLTACQVQNSDFLSGAEGFKVVTQNDFPRQWGLGTSSTLIAALGRWANVDPYKVLFETIGGSGYDIACAYAPGPILYTLDEGVPRVQAVEFKPVFSENLYFVYLGKKQDSRAGIRHYQEQVNTKADLVWEISQLSLDMLEAESLSSFETILREHERIISGALGLDRAQHLYFQDYWGETKSLGAWGGDFILATSAYSETETKAYFRAKGLDVFLNWKEMVG